MYKWLSLLSEILKYCILNEKIWWILKETSVGFFPPIPLSPTKQHHTFAQFKQNLHERGLLYAAIPGKAKTGVCWIVMCSPHQKMLRSLCIKSGGMLLPWEVSLQMKRIIRMYCSWLNALTFSLKFLHSLMMDSKAQIFQSALCLRTSALVQAVDLQRMYLCMQVVEKVLWCVL